MIQKPRKWASGIGCYQFTLHDEARPRDACVLGLGFRERTMMQLRDRLNLTNTVTTAAARSGIIRAISGLTPARKPGDLDGRWRMSARCR